MGRPNFATISRKLRESIQNKVLEGRWGLQRSSRQLHLSRLKASKQRVASFDTITEAKKNRFNHVVNPVFQDERVPFSATRSDWRGAPTKTRPRIVAEKDKAVAPCARPTSAPVHRNAVLRERLPEGWDCSVPPPLRDSGRSG